MGRTNNALAFFCHFCTYHQKKCLEGSVQSRGGTLAGGGGGGGGGGGLLPPLYQSLLTQLACKWVKGCPKS